jgi:peptidoglycan/xylan/chitin deacetylase (PgdA/CDA1 family)
MLRADRFGRLLLAAALAASGAVHAACTGTLYLTLDTNDMSQAENIARILDKYQAKATFFIANKKTIHGDYTLDPYWRPYWRARVAEGHAFGTHTWNHWYFRADLPGGKVKYARGGETRVLDAKEVCEELRKVDTQFRELTGRSLDPIWRAPGGHTTPNTLAAARACGYRHVGWSKAGFLGDELPSDKYPNDMLLKRALKNLRDGDIIVMHLGIQSRKDPLAPILDPLIAEMKRRGFCFATLPKARE